MSAPVALPYRLPTGTSIVDGAGRDAGLRFVDVDEDGRLDVLFSDDQRYSLHLFADGQKGWSRQVLAGKRGTPGALPPISKGGTNNGAFFHSRALVIVNEHTALLPGLSDRRSFNDLLAGTEPEAKSPQASLRCLRPEGRILPIGFAGGTIPKVLANIVMVKNIAVLGLYMGYYKIDARDENEAKVRAIFDQLGAWFVEGRINPVTAAIYPLERIAEAFARVLDRASLGHVSVAIGSDD